MLRSLINRIKPHLPFVPRSLAVGLVEVNDRLADEIDRLEAHLENAIGESDQLRAKTSDMHHRHRKALAQAEARADELITKLIKIKPSLFGEGAGALLRCCVDFDPQFVHGAFIHGNDRAAIEFLASRIAHLVEQELRTINFFRLPQYQPQDFRA